ncbi:MAG: autotransporter outer membrane beta-barrel domain-containing protein, partial [Planctomycetota bacterium]
TGANITFDQTGGGALTLTSVTTTDGTIDVSADSGNIIATLVTAGTGGDILLDTANSGDITLGSLTAAGDKITIDSAGSIDDAAADAVTDLTADELDLDAADGIGAGAAIETVATTIDADTTGNGAHIDIDNASGSATELSSVSTTGTGANITFDQTGGGADFGQTGGALTLTTATTTTGNIDIDATSGIQIGGSIAAGGAYDITASGGDVIFAANGKVTGSSTSSIEATAGSIANTGSDEATTIETTGAGSNLTLTAANATTQSTKPMTIVSGGDLTLNAPLDNTSSTTTLRSVDNLAINKNITDAGSISAHSGTDGTGDVTFGAGVTLDAPTINLRSGDGPGGGANAVVDIMTNTPTVVADTLSIRQDGQMGDSVTPWNPNVTNNASIDLISQSDESSIYTTDADSWQSITAEARDNIELIGSWGGDIKIASAGLLSHEGGVNVVSNGGSIYTPGAGGALNAPITGYSDESADIGVDLPYAWYAEWIAPGSSKKAAIVIQSSSQDLKLGPDATLTANGTYDPTQFDDRLSFLADSTTSEALRGDEVDVAIYLGGYNVDMGSGSVWIENKSLSEIGTLAIDAYDTVTFTDAFENSLPGSTIRRLEVVSRLSPDIETAIDDDTLPYADNPSLLADGLYLGTYILRGKYWVTNEVLGKREEVPIVPPKLQEPEEQGEVEDPDTEALVALLEELGIGVQPHLARAYLHEKSGINTLNTDLRLFKAAEKLQKLIPILEDTEGKRIAALRVVVGQFFSTLASISDEQMASFRQELAGHVGDGTDYDLARQTISSLTGYVEILSTDIGWPTDRSMAFVMGRYIPRLTEGNAIRTAVVQIRMQEALGI